MSGITRNDIVQRLRLTQCYTACLANEIADKEKIGVECKSEWLKLNILSAYIDLLECEYPEDNCEDLIINEAVVYSQASILGAQRSILPNITDSIKLIDLNTDTELLSFIPTSTSGLTQYTTFCSQINALNIGLTASVAGASTLPTFNFLTTTPPMAIIRMISDNNEGSYLIESPKDPGTGNLDIFFPFDSVSDISSSSLTFCMTTSQAIGSREWNFKDITDVSNPINLLTFTGILTTDFNDELNTAFPGRFTVTTGDITGTYSNSTNYQGNPAALQVQTYINVVDSIKDPTETKLYQLVPTVNNTLEVVIPAEDLVLTTVVPAETLTICNSCLTNIELENIFKHISNLTGICFSPNNSNYIEQ